MFYPWVSSWAHRLGQTGDFYDTANEMKAARHQDVYTPGALRTCHIPNDIDGMFDRREDVDAILGVVWDQPSPRRREPSFDCQLTEGRRFDTVWHEVCSWGDQTRYDVHGKYANAPPLEVPSA
jgi:hypothetical protein